MKKIRIILLNLLFFINKTNKYKEFSFENGSNNNLIN